MDEIESIHPALMGWLEMEQLLKEIFDDAGVPEKYRRKLLGWGQDKWVSLSDRELSISFSLRASSESESAIQKETAGVVAAEVVEQIRRHYVELITSLFIDLLLMKLASISREEEGGEGF